jgi:hypothetical protein
MESSQRSQINETCQRQLSAESSASNGEDGENDENDPMECFSERLVEDGEYVYLDMRTETSKFSKPSIKSRPLGLRQCSSASSDDSERNGNSDSPEYLPHASNQPTVCSEMMVDGMAGGKNHDVQRNLLLASPRRKLSLTTSSSSSDLESTPTTAGPCDTPDRAEACNPAADRRHVASAKKVIESCPSTEDGHCDSEASGVKRLLCDISGLFQNHSTPNDPVVDQSASIMSRVGPAAKLPSQNPPSSDPDTISHSNHEETAFSTTPATVSDENTGDSGYDSCSAEALVKLEFEQFSISPIADVISARLHAGANRRVVSFINVSTQQQQSEELVLPAEICNVDASQPVASGQEAPANEYDASAGVRAEVPAQDFSMPEENPMEEQIEESVDDTVAVTDDDTPLTRRHRSISKSSKVEKKHEELAITDTGPQIDDPPPISTPSSPSDLIGDRTRPHSLPCYCQNEMRMIEPKTLSGLIAGDYNHLVVRFEIIDCRYPFEFCAGHVVGAQNIYRESDLHARYLANVDSVSTVSSPVLVFYCEFSSMRAPSLYRALRTADRNKNADKFPFCHYPELYLLAGGYKQFYSSGFMHQCEPAAYQPMQSKKFAGQLRHFRTKSKTWSCNLKKSVTKNRLGLKRRIHMTKPRRDLCIRPPSPGSVFGNSVSLDAPPVDPIKMEDSDSSFEGPK